MACEGHQQLALRIYAWDLQTMMKEIPTSIDPDPAFKHFRGRLSSWIFSFYSHLFKMC
jgi:hypothetical protein